MTPILAYNYRDTAEFQAAAVQMAQGGYYPISQPYTAGTKSHSAGLFILGLIGLLFFIVPGILILLVWAVVTTSPPGMLTVTYQLTGIAAPAAPETFDGWVHRVGVREARAAVERDVQNATITRDDYANRVAAIDRLQLD
jgi:hypothetical protein